jgi:predicted RNA-binding Zn-ribbon protein involved in translation (DUF1610 family)
MRGVNLQAIRARVERLSVDCPSNDVIFVSWEQGDHNQCEACGFDLLAYVRTAARQQAAVPGAVFVWVRSTHELTECPQCGNPNPAIERAGIPPQ